MSKNYAKISTIIILLFITYLMGCSTQKTGYIISDKADNKISMSEYELLINDERSVVTGRMINLPDVTFPGQKDKLSPRLNDEFFDSLKKVVGEFSKPGSDHLIFEITLLEGNYGFSADGWSEEEIASCKLELNVKEKNSGNIIASSTGQDSKSKKVIDTSNLKLEQLYFLTAQQALVNAIEKLEFEKN
jgi:hypothetical protein